MGQALLNPTHKGKIAPEDYRRVVLWLDANALRLGAFHDEEKQMRGELVWPKLDVDPANPQGLERPRAAVEAKTIPLAAPPAAPTGRLIGIRGY
jgi:hypothetical protein